MELSFLKLLNTSISASWLILVVIGLRLVLKKVPKSIHCLLWAMVAVRLMLPFSIESEFSLVPSAQTVPEMYLTLEGQTREYGAVLEVVGNSFYPQSSVQTPVGTSIDRVQVQDLFLSVGWAVGVGALALYALVSYLRLRHKVAPAVNLRENIWVCDYIDTPFILGLFRPRIYLPSGLGGPELTHVLSHERAHLKRKDHWWKPLGFILLTVYWFNPLIWVAYILLCRDIEMACDERVIRDLDLEEKKAYSVALLNCSVKRYMIAACPLAFGEVGVKARVKSVLNYKKPAFWVIVIAIIVCIVVAVCFLTDPAEKPTPAVVFGELSEEQVEWAQATFWKEAGTEHLLLTQEQIEELAGLLKKIDSGAYVEKRIDHDLSVMLNWDGKEILLQWDGTFTTFIWDSETAERVENLEWGVQDSGLNEFFRTLEASGSRRMTLEDVVFLAQKGEELTWEALEPFYGVDIGSGLFVWKYPIDDTFELVASSGSMEGKPSRVVLVTAEEEIDIFAEDVEAFIERNRTDRVYSASFGIANMTVPIPKGWEYEEIPYTDSSRSFGVAFWPEGVSEGRVELTYYVQGFGVCGTGLETLPGLLANGEDVSFGYYDGSEIWSYMTYNDLPGSYVAQTYQVGSWWAEYESQVELILGSAKLADGLVHRDYIVEVAAEALQDTAREAVKSFDAKLASIAGSPTYMAIFDSGNQVWWVGLYFSFDSSPRGEVYLDVYGNLLDWEDWGITLYAENVTNQGLTLVCDQYGSVPGDKMTVTGGYQAQLMTGSPFWLEKLADGKWEQVLTLYEEVAWTMEGQVVNRNDTISWKVDWGYLYGELEPGTYRIGKNFSMSNYLEESEQQNYYATFQIMDVDPGTASVDFSAEENLAVICSSPLESSAPGAYIEAHREEYDQLLANPEETLRYCFGEFLNGGQTDLRGHIMMSACWELLDILEEAYELEGIYFTGQDWFDAYYDQALHRWSKLTEEEIRTQMPVGYILRDLALCVEPLNTAQTGKTEP